MTNLRNLRRKILYGGLGSWETNRQSQSYVPRSMRKEYYCGALWFAKKQSFSDICMHLSNKTKVDLENGVIAIHNDESHLNSWATFNTHSVLPPSFCFANDYPNLREITPVLLAIDKNLTLPGEL
jgi:hypothetical protein